LGYCRFEDYVTIGFKFSAYFDLVFASYASHYSRLVKIIDPWKFC